MTTGEKVGIGESHIVHILQNWIDTLNVATKTGLAFLPWLKYIAPDKSGYNDYVKAVEDLHNLTKSYFEKHKMSRKQSQSKLTKSHDLINAYLDQLEECKDPLSSFYGDVGYKNAFLSVVAMLLAGSETTSSVLTWLVFYLVVNPQVQKKLQEEIDQNLGTDRDPALTDRQRMKYTDAVIMETLRHCSLVPFGTIHKLLGKIKYDDYILPKGTLLLANLYHANHDSEVWGDPEIFRPERFLVDDENERKRLRDNVVTFNEGRRLCPGEQMTKDAMFLFTAKLFQKYNFYPEKERNINEYLKPMEGYVLLPPKLPVIVKPRK